MTKEIIMPGPDYLAAVDPALLHAVAEGCENLPKQHKASTKWDYSILRDGGKFISVDSTGSELHPTVAEPVRAILEMAGVKPIADVCLSIDISPVSPQTSQRDLGWHRDGVGAGEVFTVCDVLPTEFLTGKFSKPSFLKTGVRGAYRAETMNLGANFNKFPDKILEKAGLQIESGEQLVITRFDGRTIHRSQKNNSEETIQRTWLRIIR